MKTFASWIRDVDETLFARALAFAPGVRLVNARTAEVNVTAADALLLTGGGDVASEYLSQPVATPALIRGVDLARDQWEFAAVRTFFGTGRPILGICRGHQVLNVALGGTLLLDIPGHNLAEQRDREVQPLRYEDVAPADRRFARVNSSHHQAVERPGDGFAVEAWCADDGIVEQVCHRTHPWCVGVQFHPERSQIYESLFRSLVAACG